MSAISQLNWNYVTDYRDPKFMVKGTRIAQAVRGFQSRFALVEVRTRDHGVTYGISDAETVSDAEVKVGVLPKIVKWSDDAEELLSAIDRASEKLEAKFEEEGDGADNA